ncbi:MAG: protein of avirulence locus involved in temperature-dependent protein secretion [Proteobacteria bacterium]|jgi:type VI secretion system protein ImpE|nr:protein of avirulence locus involved in temperature-dependent protein secretion [Pseudomonadota bacterium]
MQAQQLLRDGHPQEALQSLQAEIRKAPADASLRVFLFQLLAVLGQWERALTQLNVLSEMDAKTLPMAQTYREAIRCELLRADVFAGRRSPLVFGDPEPWMALLLEAVRLTADGHLAQAQAVRDRAFEAAAATAGTLDGQSFAWIADADPRLGPMLEVIVNGRYYWTPFQRIQVIALEQPADLRDFVWMPAHFTWANGGETVGLIPARYPGSHASADPLVQLGRKTGWLEGDDGTVAGLGQRMLATDQGEYSLLDIRRIDLNPAAAGLAGTADG